MRSNRTSSLVVLVSLLAAAAPGCATRGSVRDLEARLDAQDRRLDALEGQVGEVSNTAEQAVRRAEAAEAEARRAAGRADDAARKADAIFTKSVRK
jgi:murein lipoprotein